MRVEHTYILTLRHEQSLRILEDVVLRRLSVPKGEEEKITY
jgi:hypothetical protein